MTVAFFVASLAASAQVQSAVNLHPANPFPFQTDALKQAWINANPKDYVRMGGDKPIVPTTATGATPEFTTQADKDAWLVQQEANAILTKEAAINAANPPTVITQAEKEAWLAAHPAAPVQNVPAANNLQTLNANAVVTAMPTASTATDFTNEVDKEAWLQAQNASQVQAELNAKLQFIAENGIIVEPVTP